MRESVGDELLVFPLRVSQIDIEHLLGSEEIRHLLEQAEHAGTIRASDLAEIARRTS
ncbi:MAG TPA: hypothetical protein VNJ46_05945 [Gaiellaceae bacterium]|nr:hypothetical protein [Gaiellaceae bacterium]